MDYFLDWLYHFYSEFSENLKKQVQENVQVAFEAEKLRSSQFDEPDVMENEVNVNEERPQPGMFKGSLKHYQLKGMNWLANLYDQVIFQNFFFKLY